MEYYNIIERLEKADAYFKSTSPDDPKFNKACDKCTNLIKQASLLYSAIIRNSDLKTNDNLKFEIKH